MPAWRKLADELRASGAECADTCKIVKAVKPAVTAPRMLEEGEAILVTGLRWLNRVQPKLERFYATLSNKQKARLDAMISQRHR